MPESLPSSLRELLTYAKKAGLIGRYQSVEQAPHHWHARVMIIDGQFTGFGSDRRAALNKAAVAAIKALQREGHNVYGEAGFSRHEVVR